MFVILFFIPFSKSKNDIGMLKTSRGLRTQLSFLVGAKSEEVEAPWVFRAELWVCPARAWTHGLEVLLVVDPVSPWDAIVHLVHVSYGLSYYSGRKSSPRAGLKNLWILTPNISSLLPGNYPPTPNKQWNSIHIGPETLWPLPCHFLHC